MLLIIVGVQSFFFGLIGEMLVGNSKAKLIMMLKNLMRSDKDTSFSFNMLLVGICAYIFYTYNAKSIPSNIT